MDASHPGTPAQALGASPNFALLSATGLATPGGGGTGLGAAMAAATPGSALALASASSQLGLLGASPMGGFHTPVPLHMLGADTPGSGGSFGAHAVSSAGRGRGMAIQPSQRWVIYYDKNGTELQRKQKGPGRLPRGAVLEGDNYIVRDCVLNKNTNEVMTVPTYVPPEQRKDKNRAETEQFLGADFLPANSMMAPMGMPQRPQLRVRMNTDTSIQDDNPYAKSFRGPAVRPADKGPEGEVQPQKGSAAYTKRLKSPYHFPAPVPPEDRDTYDKGYSLMPGGGRGEYSVPRSQMPGEESYALTRDGVFHLHSPQHLLPVTSQETVRSMIFFLDPLLRCSGCCRHQRHTRRRPRRPTCRQLQAGVGRVRQVARRRQPAARGSWVRVSPFG